MITLDSIDFSLHSIQIKDAAGDALAIGADGSLNITDNGGSLTVDGTVELGATTLAALESITVQNGAGAAAVNIQDGGNSITVDAVDLDIRNLVFATDKVDVSGSLIETVEGGYDTWSVTAVSVTTTESTVSALASRLRVEIQNLGANDIYIRESTGVSSSNGLKIPKGSSYEQALDAGAAIYMVSAAASSDIRIAQYAA